MKKKQKVQIFKLEERVLFDGAGAAEIVAAVNNAANADNADHDADDSEQGKEDKFVKNTVQNAGPVDAPAADANVQNAGEGIPQADAAQNDPADVLIQGNADFSQAADAGADFSGDVAEFVQAASEPDADASAHELVVIDADAADQFDADDFEGKNVLVLDGDSDAAEQIEDWMNEHSDQNIDSIELVTDSDTLASQLGELDAEVVSVEAFQAELDGADADNMVIVPDHDTNITVDTLDTADAELPDELTSDADADRHELVIVNSNTADLDNVLDQLGDSRDVLVIDANSDLSGLEQIENYLDQHDDAQYDAVHILTHGNDEGFYLGHQKVVSADQMAVFDGHLTDNADFMLYGCNLASTEHGQALIHDIADLTGADVAASVNLTGAASLGGDWTLEYNSGAIETASISLDSSWDHRLQTVTITIDTDAAVSAGKNYKTFKDALNYISSPSADDYIIEIKKVADNDHGPTLPYTLANDLSVQLSADFADNYVWNVSYNLTLNANLTIDKGIILNYDGGTIQVNPGRTLTFLNAENSQTHTAPVNLVGAGSQLAVGANTTVNAVTGAAGAGITMTGSSTIGTLNLNGGTWTLSTGTVNTLNNAVAATTTGSGASFGTVSNDGAFTLSDGSVSTLDHKAGAVSLTVSGGSVTTLNAYDSATINGGTITTANLTGGTIGISGGTFATVEASTLLNVSGGTFTQLNQNGSTLNLTGGNVAVLNNLATANITNAAANVNHLVNSGVVSYSAGNVASVENQAGTITFNGGNVSGTVENAQGAVLDFNANTSTGQIENSGTVNLNNITLSIATDSDSRAIINRKTGTINFTNAALANSNSTGPGVYMGIGLANTDGGTVNAGTGNATISGFAFATEQAYTSPPAYFTFTSNNNGEDILSSITVTGTDTVNTVETMDKALAKIIADSGTYFSINILLDLVDYPQWVNWLTVSGAYGSPISNLRGITSNTKVNSQYITQNVILNSNLTLAPADSDHTVLFNDVILTVNAGKSLAVSGTLALNGASPQIESVAGLGTPFPTATLKAGASTLINNGNLTADNVTGTYNNITGKLQSIVNNGTFTLNGNYALKALTVSYADIVSGIKPEVNLIYNTGTFTAQNGSTLTGTIPAYASTSAMIWNADTGNVTIGADAKTSTLTLQSDSGEKAFAIYNDGKLTLTNTFVNATGSETYGLFNGVNGDAVFKVTRLTDIDLSKFVTKAAGNQVLREYAGQIYHIKGDTYSVYNQGQFSTLSSVSGGPGYSIVNGLLTGTKDGISYKDAPVSALIGKFKTDAPADGAASTTLQDITLVGAFASTGTAKNNLINLRLNGNLDNTISEIYVAGTFMPSDLTVGNNTNTYYGYYGSSGNHTAITITNKMSTTEGSRKGGAIYFGQKAASMVTFKSDLDYIFNNLSGEMSFNYFGGLSSENNPAQFFNRGVMTIDGTNAAGQIDGLYRLYVEQVAAYYTESTHPVNYAVAKGISDAGIVNFYANRHGEASPIENQLTLTNLDVRNTRDASAAVTNYAGNLTVNGGKLSATYSALDNMEEHIIVLHDNSYYTFDVITGIANLNGVAEIAGAAYSVRNNGELTVTGPKSGYTLFTNKLAFSSNYQGAYTAVLNSVVDVSVWEVDVSENNVTRATVYYGWNSAFSSLDNSPLPRIIGSNVLASSHLYHMTSASISDRTEITLTLAGTDSPASGTTYYDYNPAKVVSTGIASLGRVSLLAKSTPGDNTAFSNWGDLTVKGIDGTNAFNGFKYMLDVSNSYYATYSKHSTKYDLKPETVTSTSDIEVGFEITASTIKSGSVPWEITMRGVKDPSSLYGYSGNFAVDGSALSVSAYGELSLINFSVFAKNAANAIQVDGGGLLHVFNGVYDDATHQWIGGSNAVISSDGNANGVMLYGSMELINGAITECVNGIVASGIAGPLLVINSTIAGNSGWGIISNFAAPSDTGKHNLFVADSTIAYNDAGGIQVNNGGKLSMVNSIVLNRNTSGTASVDVVLNGGSTMAQGFEGNVYGSSASDTDIKMNAVYGSLSLTWSGADMYTISQVKDNTYAWNASIQWGFKDDGSTHLFLSDIVIGSGGTYSITYDKMGNGREPSGDRIGSYVLTGSVGPTAMLVNTLQDSDDIISGATKLYSLRYVINYLLSGENAGASTMVAFDWGALHKEGGNNMTITLNNIYGSLDVSRGGSTPIDNLTIDLAASGYEIPAGYTLNIDGSSLSGSTFKVSGIALSVNGAQALTVTGATTANDGAAFNLADAGGTSLTLTDLTVTGGKTTGNGGAVYVGGANASLTAAGTTFNNNTAANGGAIYNNGGSLTIDGGVLSGNTATANGGAIFNAGTADVTGDVTGNQGLNGAGIYNTGKLTVNGNLANNIATVSGGGLYNKGTATVTGDVTGNKATADGAGILNAGKLAVNGNLANNIATNNGGAIYNYGGSATVTGSITGNQAAIGAGIYNVSGSADLTGDLVKNTASGEGAAIYIENGSVNANGSIIGNTGDSIIYVADGQVQVGSLDSHVFITGNQGALVLQDGGDVLIVNAAVRENDAGTGSLFEISDGVFTLLNTTVTANTGDVLTQSGGKVQIGDSTIAFNADDSEITVTGGTLDVLNSIINVADSFTITNQVASLINEDVNDIFLLKDGIPQGSTYGTLKIKLSGKAGRGGVLVGYTRNASETTLYYTTDGQTWHEADGSAVSVPGITAVTISQNGSARLFNGYAFLCIGAYSLDASELSLEVTASGDESQEGETTLRDAMEYADYLYLLNGQVQTVTFKVKDVYLNSTITVSTPVILSGGGVTISAVSPSAQTSFAGDSVFVIDGNAAVQFANLTVSGMKGVRGFRVDQGNLTLNGVTVRNGQADGSVAGSEALGGAIYVKAGSSLNASGLHMINNQAKDAGAAIYSQESLTLNDFSAIGNVSNGGFGNIIYAKGNIQLTNGVLNDNRATGNLIKTPGTAALITVSASGNSTGSSLLNANSADIVNSTLTGNPDDGAALVHINSDLNVANSIIVTGNPGGTAVLAGDISSVYSIYSGTLENTSVDVENLTGIGFDSLFTGRSDDGRLVIAENSPAAVGVWTMYDADTRKIAYSERPEGIWTVKYKPENMNWRYLGGAAAKFQASLLVGNASEFPSIGAYWLNTGMNHPDYGPGVNTNMINPTWNGGFGFDWGYNSVVNSYLLDPASTLSDPFESGMGWYASMLSELFGFKGQQTGVLSVFGGIPAEELDLSVDASAEDFGEFQEAPYHAEDGTPLSESELNDIRSAAVTGRVPAESVRLDSEVSGQVAASLRSAEPFKDGFDKALDYLLGLDA